MLLLFALQCLLLRENELVSQLEHFSLSQRLESLSHQLDAPAIHRALIHANDPAIDAVSLRIIHARLAQVEQGSSNEAKRFFPARETLCERASVAVGSLEMYRACGDILEVSRAHRPELEQQVDFLLLQMLLHLSPFLFDARLEVHPSDRSPLFVLLVHFLCSNVKEPREPQLSCTKHADRWCQVREQGCTAGTNKETDAPTAKERVQESGTIGRRELHEEGGVVEATTTIALFTADATKLLPYRQCDDLAL